MPHANFEGRVLFLGYGAVAQCTIPILLKMINIREQQIVILDMVDPPHALRFAFHRVHLVKENLDEILSRYLRKDDLLIDLAWEIDTRDLLKWCYDHGVLYTNASLERWEPYMDATTVDPREFTLYTRHAALTDMIKDWPENSPTAIIDHGANPGLVSHLVKRGLRDIARKVLTEPDVSHEEKELLRNLLNKEKWNELANSLNVKTIHISERDTQISNIPKKVNEFVNTWSPQGLYEEAIAPAELGWGTHEKTLPSNAMTYEAGPRNQILLTSKGMDTFVRSWVPDYDIVGMVVRHGEAYTISDYLSVKNQEGEVIYRPTVHYAYCASDAAIQSLYELRMNHYTMPTRTRVLKDDIVSGKDTLGCLLMGHRYKAWWIGSILDIAEARSLVPHENATTIQVAATMAAGVRWMLMHPHKGVRVPDRVPYEEILHNALPYLGEFVSKPVDWSPLQSRRKEAPFDYTREKLPEREEWQFKDFLLQ